MTLTLRGLLFLFAIGYVSVAALFGTLVNFDYLLGVGEPTWSWTGFTIAMTVWTVQCAYVYFNNKIDPASN